MRVVSRTETQDHVFSAISKEEVQPISAFLQSKGVKLKNEMEEVMDLDPVSDDDDDEDASIPSEDEGRSKQSKPAKKAANDEDEESGEEFLWFRAIAETLQKTRTLRKSRLTVVRQATLIPIRTRVTRDQTCPILSWKPPKRKPPKLQSGRKHRAWEVEAMM